MLRYVLIGAQNPHNISGRSTGRQEPYRERRRGPGTIFKVIFEGLFGGWLYRILKKKILCQNLKNNLPCRKVLHDGCSIGGIAFVVVAGTLSVTIEVNLLK